MIGNGAFAAVFAALIGRDGDDERVSPRDDPPDVPLHAGPDASGRREGAGQLLVGSASAARRGLALGAGVAMIRARGFDVSIDSGDVRRLLLGTIVMSALWAAFGVGLGALVRNQVLAIVGLFAWVFVVEILLFQYLPAVARFGRPPPEPR